MAAITASPLPTDTPSSPASRRSLIPSPLSLPSQSQQSWQDSKHPLPALPSDTTSDMQPLQIPPLHVDFGLHDWPNSSEHDTTASKSDQHLADAVPAMPDIPPPPPPPHRVLHHGQQNMGQEFQHLEPSHNPQLLLLSTTRRPDAPARTSSESLPVTSTTTTSTSDVRSGVDSRPADTSIPGTATSLLVGDMSVAFLPVDQQSASSRPTSLAIDDPRCKSTPDLSVNPTRSMRLPTPTNPTSNSFRRASLQRPSSAYSNGSTHSDQGPRGRSPSLRRNLGSRVRTSSSHSQNSPDNHPTSYAELLKLPYPQAAPAPLSVDNAHLRNAVGTNAALLSTKKTLEMYRLNVKKTNDFSVQYSFAVFLIATAQEHGLDLEDVKAAKPPPSPKNPSAPQNDEVDDAPLNPHELVREARTILQKLANNGYPFAQYYLADGYASGLFSKGKSDYNSAFPLFVLAAKRGHAESAYRTALCYEFGWGCRRDPTKATPFLRTAATKKHPGAMSRLGRAYLSGDLGEKRYREGLKWLKLAAESADSMYNSAPFHLACLYGTGFGDDVFQDEAYAAELYTQAASLGHAEASFRMGEAYECGKLQCPKDPALSVHFYTGAAVDGHPGAMMGLCAWYLVGAPPILPRDEEEACAWAHRAADLGHVKAQYAMGYFTEMGIGCRREALQANVWYVKAADAGDERAKMRLAAIRAAVSGDSVNTTETTATPSQPSRLRKKQDDKEDKDCVVM